MRRPCAGLRHRAGVLFSGLLFGCSAPQSVPRVEPMPPFLEVREDDGAPTGAALLGVGFGRIVTIEALASVCEPGKGSPVQVLYVSRVNGKSAPLGLRIAWTYGGWLAERPEPAGHGGLDIEPGKTYRLRGYETGRWTGSPRGIHEILGDEFGPRAVPGFGFENTFRVIEGRPLDRGARSPVVE